MAPKPLSVPRWATFGVITEPSSGHKDTGHVAGEVLVAGKENWFKDLASQWCAHLDTIEAYPHTWTALNQFNAGVNVNGTATREGIISSASVNYPGIYAAGYGTTPGIRVFDSGAPGGFGIDCVQGWISATDGLPLRVYREASPGVVDPIYAGVLAAIRGRLETNGLTISGTSSFLAACTFGPAAACEFNDVATFTDNIVASNLVGAAGSFSGVLGLNGTTNLSGSFNFTGAAPTSTAAASNTFTGIHVSKAWAHIACNGTATTTLLDGLNMNAAPTQVGAIISVAFKSPMADANYAVVANVTGGAGSVGHECAISSVTVNGFDITLTKYDGTFPTLGGSNPWRVVVDVKGRQ